MIHDGQAEEVLAVAMASAHGEFFPNIEHERRAYLRRCANAALLRLGADADPEGAREARRVMSALSEKIEAITTSPNFIRLGEELCEQFAQIGVQFQFVARAFAGSVEFPPDEPRGYPTPAPGLDTKEPPTVIPAAAPEVDDEEEGV